MTHMICYIICEVNELKYFIDAEARKRSGHKKFIEFQPWGAEKYYWDDQSLYMSYDIIKTTKLREFFLHCMSEDLIFDPLTIVGNDWQIIISESEKFNEYTAEAIKELRKWLYCTYGDSDKDIIINWDAEHNKEW